MGISSKLASFQFHSRQGNPFQGSPLRQLQAPGLTSFLRRTIRAADFLAPQPLFAWQLCSLSRAWISIRIWPFPLTSNSSIFFPQFLTSFPVSLTPIYTCATAATLARAILVMIIFVTMKTQSHPNLKKTFASRAMRVYL